MPHVANTALEMAERRIAEREARTVTPPNIQYL